jgi:hypothetical protein
MKRNARNWSASHRHYAGDALHRIIDPASSCKAAMSCIETIAYGTFPTPERVAAVIEAGVDSSDDHRDVLLEKFCAKVRIDPIVPTPGGIKRMPQVAAE